MRIDPVAGPDEAAITKQLAAVVPGVDRVRGRVVESIAIVEKARAQGLDRERQRLAFKYGETSPQVASAERKRTAQARSSAAIDAELERVRVGVVVAAPDAIILHGRVLDSKHNGIAGLTVVASGLGKIPTLRTTTDKQGYYKLDTSSVGVAPSSTPKGGTAAGTPAPDSAAKAAHGGSAAAVDANVGVARKPRLALLDGDKELHAADIRPISAGQVRYEEIVLEKTG